MVFVSLEEAGKGGAVRSSKVVRALERDAVACIWWSASWRGGSEVMSLAFVDVSSCMAIGGGGVG